MVSWWFETKLMWIKIEDIKVILKLDFLYRLSPQRKKKKLDFPSGGIGKSDNVGNENPLWWLTLLSKMMTLRSKSRINSHDIIVSLKHAFI